jgi:hypothetical protein
MGGSRKTAVVAMRSCKELRRFLGMCNYMRRFIPGYAALLQPLTSEVNVMPTNWTRATGFDRMKTVVADQLFLAHLDYSKAIFN